MLKGVGGGKRVLVLGAGEQPWWSQVRQEFGFSPDSEWLGTERRKSISTDRIIKKLDGFDLLLVQTGRIGHKVSEPVIRAAKERGIKTIEVPRPTIEAFTTVLRVELVSTGTVGLASQAGAVEPLL